MQKIKLFDDSCLSVTLEGKENQHCYFFPGVKLVLAKPAATTPLSFYKKWRGLQWA